MRTIGFGIKSVSSASLVPKPPARITTCIRAFHLRIILNIHSRV
jgi:hypothetical protein